MVLKDIPAVLVERFLEKRLVLYAGAGMSVGSGLPSGRQLAFELQNELFRNTFVNVRPSPEDPFQLDSVAQRYQLAFGRQKLNEILLKTFQRDGLRPNEAHRLAVKLFQRILTTNFDRLLEDALGEEKRYPIVVVRDLQLPNTSIPDRSVIYKLHGDIGTPDRIVITQRDFQRVPLTDGIKNELRSFFLKESILFVGYGLSDSDLIRQIEFCRSVLGQDMPKSYAVMPGAEKDTLFIKQCEEDNIDLISDTAVDFLQDLQDAAAKYSQAAPKPAVPMAATHLSEEENRYRASVCEDFKWIDFKGIPVLGGYLRVPIDKLFVSLSAVPQELLAPELAEPVATRQKHKLTSPKERTTLQKGTEGKSIFEILQENPKVVILGDPGSGKTTLLR